MISKDELKKEVETLNDNFAELKDDDLEQVTGGAIPPLTIQQVTLISTRTVSLIGLDGKPIGNPPSTPLQEVVNLGSVPGAGQSGIINNKG